MSSLANLPWSIADQRRGVYKLGADSRPGTAGPTAGPLIDIVSG